MPGTHSLSKLGILGHDGDQHYSYAKIDSLNGGNGLIIYDYQTLQTQWLVGTGSPLSILGLGTANAD